MTHIRISITVNRYFGDLRFRCTFVSLGRLQAAIVEGQLAEAVKHGDWIVFENCDLMAEWMPALECLYIGHTQSDHVHDDFRWWFIVGAMDPFPSAILRDAVKFVHQHPPGLADSMREQYEHGLADDGEAVPTAMRVEWHRFAYALNAFHAIVGERGRYGAVGWSAVYEFNETLLHDAVGYLKRLLRPSEAMPFNEFFYLIGDCLYANETVGHSDRRLMKALLRQCCPPKLLDAEKFAVFESGQLSVPADVGPEESVEHLKSLRCGAVDVGLHGNADYRRNVCDGRDVRRMWVGECGLCCIFVGCRNPENCIFRRKFAISLRLLSEFRWKFVVFDLKVAISWLQSCKLMISSRKPPDLP